MNGYFSPQSTKDTILDHLNGKITLRGFEFHGNSKDMAANGHSLESFDAVKYLLNDYLGWNIDEKELTPCVQTKQFLLPLKRVFRCSSYLL